MLGIHFDVSIASPALFQAYKFSAYIHASCRTAALKPFAL